MTAQHGRPGNGPWRQLVRSDSVPQMLREGLWPSEPRVRVTYTETSGGWRRCCTKAGWTTAAPVHICLSFTKSSVHRAFIRLLGAGAVPGVTVQGARAAVLASPSERPTPRQLEQPRHWTWTGVATDAPSSEICSLSPRPIPPSQGPTH